MRLIENSSGKDMKEENLLTAIDMYLGMPDPMVINHDNPVGFIILE